MEKKVKKISETEVLVWDEETGARMVLTEDDVVAIDHVFSQCWSCETCHYKETCGNDAPVYYVEGVEHERTKRTAD